MRSIWRLMAYSPPPCVFRPYSRAMSASADARSLGGSTRSLRGVVCREGVGAADVGSCLSRWGVAGSLLSRTAVGGAVEAFVVIATIALYYA